ncbi:MAG: hypothetical protein V4614_15780 [Pseudomonadota bacterium]
MNVINEILAFTIENASGQAVLFSEFTGNPLCDYQGPTVRHTWQVDGMSYERLNSRNGYLRMTPDASGFLLCEQEERSDNLVLLNAYGQERMRLTLPWQLTRSPTLEDAKYPSHFLGLTTPWDNTRTGEKGNFAVLAWMQCAGDYAFELDWRTGRFLWGY